MRYLPAKMIMYSRLLPLYLECDIKTQRLVIRQMEDFILDNPQYTDKYNYVWVSSIFTAMAFMRIFDRQGKPRSESLGILRESMKKSVNIEKIKYNQLSSTRYFIPYMTRYIPKYIKKHIGYGWDIDVPPCTDRECRVVVQECLIRKICNKYEVNYLIPLFCQTHEVIFGEMKGAYFLCTDQLYTGGRSCDFTFRTKQ